MKCTYINTGDPTIEPTLDPSIDPTVDPTSDPTVNPSTSPTFDPTIDPTITPTQNPTKYPTADPSFKPSTDPTRSPTPTPTAIPSRAPTRYPTDITDYDSYIEIVYGIEKLQNYMLEMMARNITLWMGDFIIFIEESYVSLSSVLEYRHFWIQIIKIGDYQWNQLETGSSLRVKDSLIRSYKPMLQFQSKIICAEWICQHIIDNFDKHRFENYTTNELRSYFQTVTVDADEQEQIIFSVVTDTESIQINSLEPVKSPPYVLYIIACISGSLVIIGIFALIFNSMPKKCSKIPGFNVVDNGKWISMIIFALQFWY